VRGIFFPKDKFRGILFPNALFLHFCLLSSLDTREGEGGLVRELHKEILRIGERNLGRDDRIVSHHGLAARFPFLDEDVVNFLLSLELSLKCDFRLERGLAEKLILRLCAHSLGLVRTAREPKRAVQFGVGLQRWRTERKRRMNRL